ncbi:hypothetical protein GCM10009840_32290 [Pseudolysinimonas kribbensis]|uniref:DUF2157 domain-containing protein n=1 Tax=Pseudolysinimonas kribbensis TaxID=433641 RepID=A0ABQ6JYD5_9MICO|nr:hypothetical protein [Pseudolysinimonas kribbensis]GMA93326.1 hypothetical protein GCM10025881_01500 [Pseudolysinimonas kribbensis]
MTTVAMRHAPGRAPSCRADIAIMRWVRWYSRDLAPEVRDDRLDELTSDLWEQRSAAHRQGAFRAGAAMVARAVRGIPADLAWRRAELRADPALRGVARGWSRGGLLTLTYLVALSALGFAILAWVRIAAAATHGMLLPSATTLTSLAIAVVSVVGGIIMLGAARRRWLAALWLGMGTVLTLHFGFLTFWTLSVTAYALVIRATMNGPLIAVFYWAGLGTVGAFFVVVALAWAPARRPVRSSR